ncbi:MAG: hypothetical protein K0S44_691 [Bacteroidetes bacterium]|jgi:hypothetical protein|nr:hypothetical protein [Bacteroidota bacterium]
MQKITNTEELREAIAILKVKQTEQGVILKEQFRTTYENLKPLNFLKKTFSQLTSDPDIRGGITSNLIGMAAGYLSKKLMIGSTYNPIKQLLGSVLQMGVTGIVTKNTDGIINTLSDIIQKFTSHKKTD